MSSDRPREQDASSPALFQALRRRLPVFLVCALTVPLATASFSLTQEREYSASASLLFRDSRSADQLFGSTGSAPPPDPQREAATNIELVSLDAVANRTASRLGRGLTGRSITQQVEVSAEGQSDLVRLTATDSSPAAAALLANAFATEFIDFRRRTDRANIRRAEALVRGELRRLPATAARRASLEERLEELQILASLQTGNAELVERATEPTSPSSPNMARNLGLGTFLGLILGALSAILLERLDRRVRDPDEIASIFHRPVLGAIPESRSLDVKSSVPGSHSIGEMEAFRMLRANLRYFAVDRRVGSVLLTSPSPGEGKSTVALHLAGTAARAGAKVLLIEADLRRPNLAQRLGVAARTGLSQLLAGNQELAEAVTHVPLAGGKGEGALDVLLSGPLPPNPTDLIESERMRDTIRVAEEHYDLVVVDTPPASIVSDAIPLLTEMSVIVVCRLGKTLREPARRLRGQLENLGASTLGVVVNSVGREGGYGYGYGYDAAAGGSAKQSYERRGEASEAPNGSRALSPGARRSSIS